MPDDDQIRKLLNRGGDQAKDIGRQLLEDRHQTARLTTNIHNRLMISVWIGGILLAAFVIFTLANTIGRSILGLEHNLEHHRSYEQENHTDE